MEDYQKVADIEIGFVFAYCHIDDHILIKSKKKFLDSEISLLIY